MKLDEVKWSYMKLQEVTWSYKNLNEVKMKLNEVCIIWVKSEQKEQKKCTKYKRLE